MSRKVKAPEKEELIELYSREGTTISSLAKMYNTSQPTVRKWLIDYDIPRKDHRQASIEANNRHKNSIKPTRKELEALYNENSIDDLERYFAVGQQTIYQWLKELDIEIRTLSDSCKIGKKKQFENKQFSKEHLENVYDRTKPIGDLAKHLNVSRSHLLKLFKLHNIEIEKLEPTWRSKAEIELAEFLVSEFPDDHWVLNDKSIINPFELDIVNVSKRIAIEYCGLYWHSEGSNNKKSDYHRKKYLLCKDKGYRLITVFESDDINKIKKLLRKLLGKTEKLGARKTIIKRIESRIAIDFHNKHHLHCGVGAENHYGLFHNDNLVMVGSFGKNRFSKKYQYECSRITSHSDITVVGGVSKLIKYFIKDVNPKSIVTFSDLRFGDGDVYTKCGFVYQGMTDPNYWYFKNSTNKLHSRVKFQKHKLNDLLETYDPDKTEFENMLDNNWDRIWDCGNNKFTWTK